MFKHHKVGGKKEQQEMGVTGAPAAQAVLEDAGTEVVKPSSTVPARLNVFLSEKARQDLQHVASIRKSSLTEVVRLGLALVKIAIEESIRGNKLMITDREGRILREVILP